MMAIGAWCAPGFGVLFPVMMFLCVLVRGLLGVRTRTRVRTRIAQGLQGLLGFEELVHHRRGLILIVPSRNGFIWKPFQRLFSE